MNKQLDNLIVKFLNSQKEALETFDRFLEAVRPGLIFGEPVTAGGRTIITASEVTVGMGLGFGMGAGSETSTDDEDEGAESELGAGGGGGGGGNFNGRPVAVIIASEDGVTVEPVFDVTKLGLAFLTALGGMFLVRSKMRKLGKS